MKKLLVFILLVLPCFAWAETLTVKATYSAEFNQLQTPTDGSDWIGNAGPYVLRGVETWSLAAINKTWSISKVEVRLYTEVRTGAPGPLQITRYGASHSEDDPRLDTGSAAFSKVGNGQLYATLADTTAPSWTQWIDIPISDLQWCLANSKTLWSVGLKLSNEAPVTHYEFAEAVESNAAELRITYTIPSSGIQQGSTVTFAWDAAIEWKVAFCDTDCQNCVVDKLLSVPLQGTVVDSGITFTSTWPTYKATGGCKGPLEGTGKFKWEIIDSTNAVKATGETTATEFSIKLDFPAGNYTTRISKFQDAIQSGWGTLGFEIVAPKLPNAEANPQAPTGVRIK